MALLSLRNAFHLYTVLAVLVFVVMVIIAYDRNDRVHAWARLPSWLANSTVLGLFVLVSLFLAGLATSFGSNVDGTKLPVRALGLFGHRVTVGVLFVLVGVLLTVATITVYRTYQFTFAFWLVLVALVLNVVHFMMLWKSRARNSYLTLPLIVFELIALYYVFNMIQESYDFAEGSYDVNAVTYRGV